MLKVSLCVKLRRIHKDQRVQNVSLPKYNKTRQKNGCNLSVQGED